MKTIKIETIVEAQFKGTIELSDSTVPAELKKIASSTQSLPLYLLLDENKLWASKMKEAKEFDLSESEEFILAFMTRAKGAGFISIMAKVKNAHHYTKMLDYGAYDERVLNRAKKAAQEIGQFLDYDIQIENWGADC